MRRPLEWWAQRACERYRRLRRDRHYRFVVYSPPRTGSTSLAQALNCYAGVRCAFEPFVPIWHVGLPGTATDVPSLERQLGWLWQRYNGFKHVWEPNGFPFYGRPELNDYVLTAAADRVVLLNRKNVLRRIVSWHISDQVKVFHLWREEDRDKLLKHRFLPLDTETIKRELQRETTSFVAVKARLNAVGLPFKVVWYEDLFRDEERAYKLRALGDVIAFITGRFRAESLDADALERLNPGNARLKINSPETYRRVPNILEIEEELGSEETGYLFR